MAWWDFNQPESYSRTVDVRAGLAAKLLGGAVISGDAEGRSGSAGDRTARFGIGAQRLHLTDASFFTGAASGNVLSVSFWVKQVATRNATMLSFIAPSVGGRGFQAHSPWSDGTMYFDTGGCCTGGIHRISVNPGATWTTWRHVALVKDGGTKYIYLDGSLRTSGANTAPISLAFTELFIGNASNTNEATNGDIDDFAVFSHALNPTEVASLSGGTAPDAIATAVTDSDGDSMPDIWETRFTGGLATLASLSADTDGDTLTNAVELARGTNPNLGDTDNDGFSDAVETETGTWAGLTNTGTSPTVPDTDGDRLLDGAETNTGNFVSASNTGSNPFIADSDGDLVNDGYEVTYGSNPVNSGSTPIVPGIPTLLAWWQFNNDATPGSSADTRAGHVGAIQGAAAYSPDAEGFTGTAGDRALRITGAGGKMFIQNAPWINIATRTDKLTVSFWQKVTTVAATSSL